MVNYLKYTLFYKQHFYKQRQAEIGKKLKQKPSSALRLNFHFLKTIRFLHPRYCPIILGDILKTCAKNKCVCFIKVVWITTMIIRMKMKKDMT